MQAGIDRGLEPARRHLLEHLDLAALLDDDLRADPRRIGPGPSQHQLQIVIPGHLAGAVSVDRGGRVEPVHDEIEGAAVVQVDVGGAVRETPLRQTPGLRQVREGQISVVVVRIVGNRDLRHFPDEGPGQPGHPVGEGCLDHGVAHIREVIQVVRPVIDP